MAVRYQGPRADILAARGRTVPEDMTVSETTEWVADDAVRAESALQVEKDKPKPRRSLVESLEPIAKA